MKNIIIKPTNKTSGEITVPGDKSISHRAIMLGALAKGETTITGFLSGADCLATMGCFREMGIEISMTNDKLKMSNDGKVIIKGKGLSGLKEPKGTLDVGNSGTTIRLMMGILAAQPFVSNISGDASIQRRPMLRVAKPLREMGGEIEQKVESGKLIIENRNGEVYPPLRIIGNKLKGINYKLPVASAQVKSAILLAGLFAEGETSVIEKNPSRDHTERMLSYLGAKIRITNYELRITSGELYGSHIDIPGDISSAAFFIVAALLTPNSELLIRNVGLNPTRTGILDVLHRMGANIEVLNERIICEEPRGDVLVRSQKSGAGSLKAIKISGEIIPRIIDEIPIIALAATQAEGITEIVGAKELRVKESDRIKTICSELRKMGANITELEDGLVIEGPTKLYGAKINSYGDHRIAMMGAVAGLIAEGETEIENTECTETSFPGFEKLLRSIAE
ncbi:MAG: 3-phosphoshikimate 1-carboxyvinyltransferase [Candidatus Margulisiibacteriota bacterium]